MTHYIEYLQTSLIAGNLQRHLMECGAVHVCLEEIGQFLAVLLAAEQPWHEVHADQDSIDGVTLEMLLKTSVAKKDICIA